MPVPKDIELAFHLQRETTIQIDRNADGDRENVGPEFTTEMQKLSNSSEAVSEFSSSLDISNVLGWSRNLTEAQ